MNDTAFVKDVVALHQLPDDVKDGFLSHAVPDLLADLAAQRSTLTLLHEDVVVALREAAERPCPNYIWMRRQLVDDLQLPLDDCTLLLIDDLDDLHDDLLVGLFGVHCSVDGGVAALANFLLVQDMELGVVGLGANQLDKCWLHVIVIMHD